jgi:hypothetical protein
LVFERSRGHGCSALLIHSAFQPLNQPPRMLRRFIIHKGLAVEVELR